MAWPGRGLLVPLVVPQPITKAQNPAQCMAYGEFSIVPPARMPAMPEELLQSGLPKVVKQTLFGIWLGQADNNPMNEWDLEAYQKIAASSAMTVARPDLVRCVGHMASYIIK